MRLLVDTNVVARLAQPTHSQHLAALGALESAISRGDDPCIVPQILYEFWVIATKPAVSNGLALSTAAARAELERVADVFTLLQDERAIFRAWERLVVQYDVKGKSAHDARLVGAMVRHGITHILTFNSADFARFREITVLVP